MSDREYIRDDHGRFSESGSADDGSAEYASAAKSATASNAILAKHGWSMRAVVRTHDGQHSPTIDPEELSQADADVTAANAILSKTHGTTPARLVRKQFDAQSSVWGSSHDPEDLQAVHDEVDRVNSLLSAHMLQPNVKVIPHKTAGLDTSHDVTDIESALETLNDFTHKRLSFSRDRLDSVFSVLNQFGFTGFNDMKKHVPAIAMHFAATVERIETKSIKIRARTTADAYQGYWGRCVHDLSTFRAPMRNVVLDYDHDSKSVIGFAANVRVENDELIADGELTPFKPDDKASEVIAKGKAGTPYQASVVMDPDVQVEEVPAGKVRIVNGREFHGPGVIFRNWTIDGIAVTPYGSDSKTSVEFSRDKSTVQVNFINTTDKELESMTEPATKPAVEAGNNPPAPPPVATAPAAAPDPGYFSRAEVTKFKTAFGALGFGYLEDGKTFEEAAKLFNASQAEVITGLKADIVKRDETIAALTTERDELKSKLTFNRGQSAPVPVKVSDDEKKAQDAALSAEANKFGRTTSQQKLVEAIKSKMPKQS